MPETPHPPHDKPGTLNAPPDSTDAHAWAAGMWTRLHQAGPITPGVLEAWFGAAIEAGRQAGIAHAAAQVRDKLWRLGHPIACDNEQRHDIGPGCHADRWSRRLQQIMEEGDGCTCGQQPQPAKRGSEYQITKPDGTDLPTRITGPGDYPPDYGSAWSRAQPGEAPYRHDPRQPGSDAAPPPGAGDLTQ